MLWGDKMPDYKEMYLTILRASERARKLMEEAENEIIKAQQQCEELYMEETGVLTFVPKEQ